MEEERGAVAGSLAEMKPRAVWREREPEYERVLRTDSDHAAIIPVRVTLPKTAWPGDGHDARIFEVEPQTTPMA